MTPLIGATLLVPLLDQAVKTMLREVIGSRELSLGSFASLRLVVSRVWIARLANRTDFRFLGPLWLAAALPLVFATALLPSLGAFAGLLLGGSLSHALESARRGTVLDYVHSPFWPSFNLADVAITVGAIGLAARLALAVLPVIA